MKTLLLKTPEYYCIDGKPVVMIWSPAGMDRDVIEIEKKKGNELTKGEGVKKLLDLSREMAKEAGLKGIYFVAMKWPEASTNAADIQWLADAGFDHYIFNMAAYDLAKIEQIGREVIPEVSAM